ncbi:MAG: hypothetical protein LBR17_07410 [Bacteroidales bacterium]|jgi:hypothetical protein|nr:hypothetical protein [Bacteroidales bacterium]
MKTLEKNSRLNKKITYCLIIVLFSASFVGCGDDPDPAPMPMISFPMPLVSAMTGTEWQNTNTLPAGSSFMAGYDTSVDPPAEIHKPIDKERNNIRFIDSINVRYQRTVFYEDVQVGTETFVFRYTFLRYEKKGVIFASTLGLNLPFSIDITSGTPILKCADLGNDFLKI